MDNPEKQVDKRSVSWWVKGQSGNPKGRPKGKTLKEWARERLLEMPDDKKAAFLASVPAEVAWRMAEGNPASNVEVKETSEVTIQDSQKIKELDDKFNAFLKGNNPSDTA